MDPSVQEIQFLDLTDIDAAERSHLELVLYAINTNLELPWQVHGEYPCTSAEEYVPPPYAVAPIPHTLRGVFLPQPLYTSAPAAVAVGLVPSVTGTEPPNGLVPAMENLQCGNEVESAADENHLHHQHSHISGPPEEAVYQEVSPQIPVMNVPPPVPTSMPPPSQQGMTTVYQMVGPGMPLSNVYVNTVTANVNVHSFVGSPYAQQVYHSSNDVSVPHETSPNAARNGGSQRRPRSSKMGNKRGEMYLGRNSSHEVMGPSPLVESPPTGTQPLHQHPNYHLISMPMHSYHQQPCPPTYYPPAPQPHGGPHHMGPHPSAQHATGTPIFLPNVSMYHPPPPTMYSTYHPSHHQPPGGGPMVYSENMNMAPSEPTTEVGYTMEEVSDERMIPEEKEMETIVHSQMQPPPPLFVSEMSEEVSLHLQNSSGNVDDSKSSNYSQQDSDVDACNIVTTVVVNNSHIVSNTPYTDDTYQNGVVDTNNRLVHQSVNFQEVRKESVSPKYLPIETVHEEEIPTEDVVASNELPRINTNSKDIASDLPEVSRDNVVINAPVQTVVTKKTDVKSSQADVSSPTVASVKHVPGVPDIAFASSSNQKLNSPSGTTPSRSSAVPNISIVASDVSSPMPVATPPAPEKSWASLFNKGGGGGGLHLAGPSPPETAIIMASPVGSVLPKPLATVRPFQNATPAHSSVDGSRRVPESPSYASPIDMSKGFPQLTPSSLPAPTMADDPNLHRLGEFLTKYQLDHRAISLQPRGLTNRSNWCYINSTLQALLACPPFYNLMKCLPLNTHRSSKSSTPIVDSIVQFVNEFVPLSPASRVNRKEKAQRKDDGSIEVQTGTVFEPSYIYKMLNNIQSDTFKVEGRQEDAEEFLSCLLNALNDEMLELIKLVGDPTAKTNLSNGDITTNGDTSIPSQDEDDTEWKVMGPKNKGSITRRTDFGNTPISNIFRGQLRLRVQRAGDQSTDNVQPFFTLPLDIEKAQSVKEALELLVGRDQLEGMTCSRTNQEIEAWQQVTLEELPLVLVLHLKWFDYKLDGCSKIVKTVEFPIDLKMDGKLMSSNKKCNPKQKQYKLFAVVYHDGKEATKGHYVTDVYHVGYGGWVRYDDNVVRAIQESKMLHPSGSRVPYLLYYRRCDTIGIGAATPDKTR